MPNVTTPIPSPKIEQSAAFKPFSWLHPSIALDASAEFEAITKDLCSGMQVCLELVEISGLGRADPHPELPPVLDDLHSEVLLRMAISICKLLTSQATNSIELRSEGSIAAHRSIRE